MKTEAQKMRELLESLLKAGPISLEEIYNAEEIKDSILNELSPEPWDEPDRDEPKKLAIGQTIEIVDENTYEQVAVGKIAGWGPYTDIQVQVGSKVYEIPMNLPAFSENYDNPKYDWIVTVYYDPTDPEQSWPNYPIVDNPGIRKPPEHTSEERDGQPQAQYSNYDQLLDMLELATQAGLYDAADWLKGHLKQMQAGFKK
ncbi:hypothetical protein LCGC14_1787490 [marine sediment metagenome]|uniref:Uncharacterized protein n=1 Tax=marine sediment metagenome TaxID=412755 RepID=A0A0F9GTH7_9ZZZZ